MPTLDERLATLVDRVRTWRRDDILAEIDNEQRGLAHDDPYRALLQGVRYLIRKGVMPGTLMNSDRRILKPLVEALVNRGADNGGLPPEALDGFD